ncbi:MAG: hypothetical protein H5T63_11295 [Chloroflexi bacterium]|nr:hypothetical protein [Chloroflexota bacterium]
MYVADTWNLRVQKFD